MRQDVVYIKAEQSVTVTQKKVFLQDVLTVFCVDSQLQKNIGNLVLYTCKGKRNEKYVFTILKVIDIITKEHPGLKIINVGENDFIVEYKMSEHPKKAWEYAKTALAAILIFIGSAFTIMTFNTDVAVADVFDMGYRLVTGHEKAGGSILEAAYSVGLVIGMLAFYNHFSSRKRHDDPTPIQIEMRTYEEEMNKAVISDASREGKTIDS